MKHTANCTQCPKGFTHGTKQKAEQALAMHIGRMHKKNIVNSHEHVHAGHAHSNGNGNGNGILREMTPSVSGRRGRSHLTVEQTAGIAEFIRTHKTEYPTKYACLQAALETVGATGQIIVNSTAVNRYFKKAKDGVTTGKRTYTKRAPAQPMKAEVQINFCPCCGTDMHAIAEGMALAAHMKKG